MDAVMLLKGKVQVMYTAGMFISKPHNTALQKENWCTPSHYHSSRNCTINTALLHKEAYWVPPHLAGRLDEWTATWKTLPKPVKQAFFLGTTQQGQEIPIMPFTSSRPEIQDGNVVKEMCVLQWQMCFWFGATDPCFCHHPQQYSFSSKME